jgi:hypothetical protein
MVRGGEPPTARLRGNRPAAERPLPRLGLCRDPAEDRDPDQRRRVPSRDETAEAVTRARDALREIADRQSADAVAEAGDAAGDDAPEPDQRPPARHRRRGSRTSSPARADRAYAVPSYIVPTEPLTAPGAADTLRQALGDLRPILAILDGATEAMSLHGLEMKDNTDVAHFGRLLTRLITDHGTAVLSLDHVTKDRETRGRYAIGGVHKLNGLNGAALVLENYDRFGAGMAAAASSTSPRTRSGQLRRHAVASPGDRYWFGDFTLDTGDQADPAGLHSSIERTEPERPHHYMAKVAAALAAHPNRCPSAASSSASAAAKLPSARPLAPSWMSNTSGPARDPEAPSSTRSSVTSRRSPNDRVPTVSHCVRGHSAATVSRVPPIPATGEALWITGGPQPTGRRASSAGGCQ